MRGHEFGRNFVVNERCMKTKFYKLEAFTYEGSIVQENLDTETPWRAREYYYKTLEAAESEIRRLLQEDDLLVEYLWFFVITVIPFGRDLYYDHVLCYNRIYLSNGNLFTQSPVLYGRSRKYRGRNPEDCAFKQGDIVMVFRGEDSPVSFEIVAAQPPTPEFCKEHPASYSGWDDSYLTIRGDGPYMNNHDHPQVTQVLPLSVELPEEKIVELKRGLGRYLSDDRDKDEDYELPF